MAQSAVQDTARRLLSADGIDLDTWLHSQRSAGVGFEKIALALHKTTGGLINVSYRTVARWCDALVEEGAA